MTSYMPNKKQLIVVLALIYIIGGPIGLVVGVIGFSLFYVAGNFGEWLENLK